ncbi:MAG: hydrogenase maturation protease [Halomonas sp.]|uniref:hydrogenase maturation protease n=1 Tax=Halomonas sp. TaxID=1486246 RepID=UPI00287087A9|nr:hydrogenase maturation protease [Halomonas sp.]MDR9440270.1 hydrogenase maturation protease [Halomonas sp.]
MAAPRPDGIDDRTASHAYLFGLGSPHGGDRLGWLAADSLRDALADRDDVSVDCLAQPVDLFLHAVTADDRLLLVDAMRDQGSPGTLRVFAPGELPETAASLSSHGLDLAGTLALVEALGLFRGGIRIIGIEMPAGAAPDAPPPRLDAAQARRLHEAVIGWLDAG